VLPPELAGATFSSTTTRKQASDCGILNENDFDLDIARTAGN
jgi:hypothetical protein